MNWGNIDWAVVLATIVGPIAAILISMKLEERKTARLRRHWVFATLMGLRGSTLNPEHVRALNVVQVEFFKYQKVIEAWRQFLSHLETDEKADGWFVKHRDLLNGLLVEIAKALGINNDFVDIARGGYSPIRWANTDRDQGKVLEAKAFVADLLLSDGFRQWLAKMQNASYRAAFEKEFEKISNSTAPVDQKVNSPG